MAKRKIKVLQEAGRKSGLKQLAEKGPRYFSNMSKKRWAKVHAEKANTEAQA